MELAQSNFASGALWNHGWFLRRCAAKKDQFANASFASKEEVWTTVPVPMERNSSRDVHRHRAARSDCVAVAPIQQICRKQTYGVSFFPRTHDNVPMWWGVEMYQH